MASEPLNQRLTSDQSPKENTDVHEHKKPVRNSGKVRKEGMI